MSSLDLAKLDQIEADLLKIREILNPEDSPYICDVIVSNVKDEALEDLVMDMLINMGYKPKTIIRIIKLVRKIQS